MILSNKIQCRNCGDIIESFYVHDFKHCSCGRVFVDGGKEYCRRGFTDSPKDYIELSVISEEDRP